MAKAPRPWIVTPHDPIRQLDENLWTVDSPVPTIPGGTFPRKMSIVKLSDGTLVLHNAIPLDDAGMKQLEGLGRPAFLIAPSPFHCIDAHAMRARLGAKLLCPAAARERLREVVEPDGALDALPADPALRAETLDGTKFGESVFVVRSGGETGRVSLLFCDAFFNIASLPGFWGWVWKRFGFTGGPLTGPVWMKRAVNDRAALRRHMERLAELPGLHRLVPSHGEVVEKDPAGTLRLVTSRIA
jgi:hypothetical protein